MERFLVKMGTTTHTIRINECLVYISVFSSIYQQHLVRLLWDLAAAYMLLLILGLCNLGIIA